MARASPRRARESRAVSGNHAPRCEWAVFPEGWGNSHRRLIVNGEPSDYFIRSAERSHHRHYRRHKHTLLGSGMHPNGGAAVLETGPRVALLMHRAEQMALGAT